ncbi:MAG: hypothetical protein MJ162_08315 [Treponema sp.]|nr:hypothetical protein [Treponema sp.]
MTDIRKFLADVEKSKKMCRQNNGGAYDYHKLADNLQRLFNRASGCPTELPDTIFNYWENAYVLNSPDLQNEPSSDHLEKLAAMLAFLNNSDEMSELLTDEDWQEIGSLVGYEADDLPIDILQDLMKILVEHNAY